MPRLIIPNVWDSFNTPKNSKPNQTEWKKFEFYSWRCIWLMDPGDILIVPSRISNDFLDYFAAIRKNSLDKFNFININELVTAKALTATTVIAQLKEIIDCPHQWIMEPRFYNEDLIALMETLKLPQSQQCKELASDLASKMNSKIEFRQLAAHCEVPIPEGTICSSSDEFEQAINRLFPHTNQILVKQDISAGGEGNIGLGFKEAQFAGASRVFFIDSEKQLNETARTIWQEITTEANQRLIVEIFYPNSQAFTCETIISENKKYPQIMNYGQILHQNNNLIGVETPAHKLKPLHVCELIDYSLRLANHLQVLGYYGYLSCDAIITGENELRMTEINARMSGAMHAYYLTEKLLGKDYINQATMLLRFNLKIDSFLHAYQALNKEKLIFNNGIGVILLYANASTTVGEILTIAPTAQKACEIQQRALDILNGI